MCYSKKSFKTRKIIVIFLMTVELLIYSDFSGFIACASPTETARNDMNPSISNSIKITILYDNYVYKEGTTAEWGFSCLIEGVEDTILFDTGTDGKILMDNINQLGVNLKQVEKILLSHQHHDHIGGMEAVLKENSKLTVYVPESFAQDFCEWVIQKGAKLKKVSQPIQICESVYSTGEMGSNIREQALIIETREGLIIVTGCSHPGIVNILHKANEIKNKDIYLVVGGFHLLRHSNAQVRTIIQQFKELGVKKVGPTHCTGDNAIKLFEEAYENDYIKIGTGRVLTIK
jgi:7,8-dihydropterin-6-yl-methyl-4-(beta-D-ribofuranosyl)aminobenzene 5'-phosphate synthase